MTAARDYRPHEDLEERPKNPAKEYLSRGYLIDQKIRKLEERKDRYHARAMGGTSRITAERVSGTSSRSKVEDAVCAALDLEAQIGRELLELAHVRAEICEMIGRVESPTYKALLEKRYLHCMTWIMIADEMHYSERQVIRLHGGALQVVNTFLKRCHEMSP
jgi:hypothetical protein